MQERNLFSRKKPRMRALNLVKSNEKTVKKLIKNQQNKSIHSSLYSEESLYDDNEMESEKELLKKRSSIQKTKTLSYENLKIPEVNSKSFIEDHKNDNSFNQEAMEGSLEKKKEPKEFNRFLTLEIPKEEKKSMFRESKFHSTLAESQDNKILKEPSENYKEKNEFTPLKINSMINILFNSQEFGLDKVHIYKNYFPSFNVSEISKNQGHLKNMEKDIMRRYLKRIYRKFKDYSFFVNEILEKFWREKKKIKNNKSKENHKIGNSNGSDNNISKKENNYEDCLVHSPARVNVSPKKSFFKQSEEEGKIKSFTELIQTLIKKKNKNASPNENNQSHI